MSEIISCNICEKQCRKRIAIKKKHDIKAKIKYVCSADCAVKLIKTRQWYNFQLLGTTDNETDSILNRINNS